MILTSRTIEQTNTFFWKDFSLELIIEVDGPSWGKKKNCEAFPWTRESEEMAGQSWEDNYIEKDEEIEEEAEAGAELQGREVQKPSQWYQSHGDLPRRWDNPRNVIIFYCDSTSLRVRWGKSSSSSLFPSLSLSPFSTRPLFPDGKLVRHSECTV